MKHNPVVLALQCSEQWRCTWLLNCKMQLGKHSEVDDGPFIRTMVQVRFAWPRTAGSHQDRVIPRYQTYKMRLKQLLCRGQTEAYFPDHSLCCSCRRISWLRVEDADSWSSLDTFLHGSEQHFKRDFSPSSWSIGRSIGSIDLPFLALQFGVRALWFSQQ